MNLFFEQNYTSTEVKPFTPPKFGNAESPKLGNAESPKFGNAESPKFGKLCGVTTKLAEEGQNPCMEILLPTAMPRFRDEAHKLAYIRMRKNMLDTIKSVGGNFDGIDLTKLTVSELLLTLCTNNVSFVKTVVDNSR